MKNLTLFFSIFFLILSCKKEKIDVPELVGKWQFRGFNIITLSGQGNPSTALNGIDAYESSFGYDVNNYGEVNLEILEKGMFIFTSETGEEQFRVLGKESISIRASESTIPFQQVTLNGWNFKLKSTSGQRFEFKLYFDQIGDRIFTVPWTKGSNYFSYKAPYSGAARMYHLGTLLAFPNYTSGGGSSPSTLYSVQEYLGKFKRI